LKLTVVGDKGVGKTCLLKSYVYRSFPEGPYVSTVFPYLPDEEYVYSKSIDYSGTPLLLAMWDRVYSNKEDDFIRSLQYDQMHDWGNNLVGISILALLKVIRRGSNFLIISVENTPSSFCLKCFEDSLFLNTENHLFYDGECLYLPPVKF
ncbi:hypothetical protein NPIL_644031, partial [Nephila pilipes]